MTTDRLKVFKEKSCETIDLEEKKRGKFKFSMCSIKPGEIIEYLYDSNIKATVVDDKHIEYKDEIMSLTSLAEELSGKKNVHLAGPHFFKYKGKLFSDLRIELERH